jgi:hypothetical protein
VGNAGPAFEVAGQGNYEEASGSLTIHVLYGTCLPGTDNPLLLADLSNQADPELGKLQLAGALVSASSTDGQTTALYRGTATWWNGPEVDSPPSAFAAQVVLDVPSDISMLRVAFFGTAPDLSGAQATCSGEGAGGTATTGSPSTGPAGATPSCDTPGSATSSEASSGSTSSEASSGAGAGAGTTGNGASAPPVPSGTAGTAGGQSADGGNGTPAATQDGSSGTEPSSTVASGNPTATQSNSGTVAS